MIASMAHSTPIGRYLSPSSRYYFVKRQRISYREILMELRDNPDARARFAEHSEPEGLENLLEMPDFVLDLIAGALREALLEGLAEARMKDPNATIEQVQLTDARLQEFLSRHESLTEWFNANTPTQPVSEEIMKRDGSQLVCRKARDRLNAGLYAQARNLFKRAAEIDPSHADAWIGMADALTALGLEEEAALARTRGALLLEQKPGDWHDRSTGV